MVRANLPGPVTPDMDSDLVEILGEDGAAQLLHLMDGNAVYAPGFIAGDAPLSTLERSPRVRFLVGQLVREPRTSQWYGPVLLESAQWRATYIDPHVLAHRDCARCAMVWARAAARDTFGGEAGFTLAAHEVSPGVVAQIATAPAPPGQRVSVCRLETAGGRRSA